MERVVDVRGMKAEDMHRTLKEMQNFKYEKTKSGKNDRCLRSLMCFHTEISLRTQPNRACMGTCKAVHKKSLRLHFRRIGKNNRACL